MTQKRDPHIEPAGRLRANELFIQLGMMSKKGILVYDVAAKRELFRNPGIDDLFDSATLSLSGNGSIRDMIADDDDYLRHWFSELMVKHAIHDVEVRLNDGQRWAVVDAFYFRQDELIVVFIQDVTVEREHTRYITEFGARKDAVLDMVAQNLSGPLNVTNSLLDLIDAQTAGVKYRSIDRHTRMIRENTQQCIEIINSFLKEEHLASQVIAPRPTRFDVIDRIRIIIERMKQFQRNRKVEVRAGSDKILLLGDDVKFFQVMHNVLSNAFKFSPENTVVSIDIDEREEMLHIIVSDNGVGIPEHLQPYIFDKHTRASRSGLKGEQSLGMGLYIVKKLVEIMKGNISYQSDEGKGTTFTLILPLMAENQ